MTNKLLLLITLLLTLSQNSVFAEQTEPADDTFLKSHISIRQTQLPLNTILEQIIGNDSWRIQNSTSINFERIELSVVTDNQSRLAVLMAIAKALNITLLVYQQHQLFLFKD